MRQQQILRNSKYPPPYITTYYREAAEAAAEFIAGGLANLGVIERAMNVLDQAVPANVHETRRLEGNIESLESFVAMIDGLELDPQRVTFRLGAHVAPHLTIRGVTVSVRPEVTVHGTDRRGNPLVGGIKLHFPKSEPMNEEQGQIVAMLIREYCRDHLAQEGEAIHTFCKVIDVASGQIYGGSARSTRRMREIEQACEHIAAIWPTITND